MLILNVILSFIVADWLRLMINVVIFMAIIIDIFMGIIIDQFEVNINLQDNLTLILIQLSININIFT